jgi:hypothetical protein
MRLNRGGGFHPLPHPLPFDLPGGAGHVKHRIEQIHVVASLYIRQVQPDPGKRLEQPPDDPGISPGGLAANVLRHFFRGDFYQHFPQQFQMLRVSDSEFSSITAQGAGSPSPPRL